jgi:hypothetical protein
MEGGRIDNNKTTATAIRAHGAGVRNVGTFTMNGGNIASNEAKGAGGGVWTSSTSGFNMTGGIIRNNSALGDDGGGGVCVSTGVFTMSGGTIYGVGNDSLKNTAANSAYACAALMRITGTAKWADGVTGVVGGVANLTTGGDLATIDAINGATCQDLTLSTQQ